MERLAVLDQAAGTHPLPEQLRQQATDVAHKLAGSLGMFGFEEGTRLARSIEQYLESNASSPEELAALSNELRQSLFPTDS